MNITLISMTNFRGAGTPAKPWSLQPGNSHANINVLYGPNGAGKTRILQALQLALTGAVPNPDTDKAIDIIGMFSKAAGGVDFMSVTVEFSGNPKLTSITRTFRMKDGDPPSVTQSLEVQPRVATGVKEQQRHIDEQIGGIPAALDVRDFKALTESERQDLVFKYCPIDEVWTEEEVLKRLKESLDKFDDDDPEYSAAMEKYTTSVKAQLRGGTIRTGLFVAELSLKENQKALKKKIAENRGASVVSTQQNVTDGKKRLREGSEIQAEYDAAMKDRDEMAETIARAKSATATVQLHQRTITDAAARVDAARKSMAELESALPPAAEMLDLEDMKKRILASKKMQEQHQADFTRFSNDARDKMNALAITQEKLDQVRGDTAPICGACGRELPIDLVSNRVKEYDDLANDRTRIEQEIMDLSAKVDILDQKIKEETANLLEMQRQIQEDEVRMTSRKVNDLRLQDRKAALVELEKQLADFKARKIEGAEHAVNVPEAETMLEGMKSRCTALQNELLEKTAYDQQVLMATKAAVTAKGAEIEQEVVKVMLESLNSIRWEIINAAMGPLREQASALFRHFTGAMDVVFDIRLRDERGHDAFKIGWESDDPIHGKTFRDFDNLSRAQQLFTIVSMLAPLIDRAGGLRILLLDNIEVIDGENMHGFIDLLEDAGQKYLDAIFVATSSDLTDHPSDTGVVCFSRVG
jgi:DNA repair exonuclease SbcCD ATPase subunit